MNPSVDFTPVACRVSVFDGSGGVRENYKGRTITCLETSGMNGFFFQNQKLKTNKCKGCSGALSFSSAAVRYSVVHFLSELVRVGEAVDRDGRRATAHRCVDVGEKS